MHIYLVRHAATAWSEAARLTSQTDPPLSTLGRQQAKALAQHLKPAFASAPFTMCSPSRRATETMSLAYRPPATHELSDLVREMNFGECEGATLNGFAKTQQPGWSFWLQGCPGGETFGQLEERIRATIDQCVRSQADLCVIFGHGVFFRAMIALLQTLPLHLAQYIVLDSASTSVVEYSPTERQFSVKTINRPSAA